MVRLQNESVFIGDLLQNRHPGFPRATPPWHPADPRSNTHSRNERSKRYDTGSDSDPKFMGMDVVVRDDMPDNVLAIVSDRTYPFYPSQPGPVIPMTPWNPLDGIDWQKFPKRKPYTPHVPYIPTEPWEDIFPPNQDDQKRITDELYKAIIERSNAVAKAEKEKAEMTKTIAALEKRIDELAERLKVVELKTGVVEAPEPIIAEDVFAKADLRIPNPSAPAGTVILMTKAEITQGAIEFAGITVEVWNNERTDVDRQLITWSYIVHVLGKS